MKLIESIKLLSSGTIGNLIGVKNYSEIDKFRNNFIDFSENLNQEMKWQEAYKSYKKYLNEKEVY